jgi:multicomponent Na+:H+ antiporter subunit G
VTFRHTAALVLLIAGGVFELIACLGLVVMRDTLDRLHCSGVVSFGAALIAVSIVVQESFSLIGNKALMIAVVLLFTTPVLGHVTARMVRTRELGDWEPKPDEESIEVIEP